MISKIYDKISNRNLEFKTRFLSCHRFHKLKIINRITAPRSPHPSVSARALANYLTTITAISLFDPIRMGGRHVLDPDVTIT